MYKFQKGDLVARVHPTSGRPIRLQTGIIIKTTKGHFTISWVSYNKTFFMEKEGDIFSQLNNSHLLGHEVFRHDDVNPFLALLNSNYRHGRRR